MINCKRCRGKGQRRCRCRNGVVKCEICSGKGKVEQWLEIAEERFVHVTQSIPNPLSEAFERAGDPEDFDSEQRWPVALGLSWSGQALEAAPADARELLHHSPSLVWHAASGADRLDRIDVQSFRSELSTVTYQLFGRPGEIEVPIWQEHPLESTEALAPLTRRLWILGSVAATALTLGLVLTFWFGSRHPFYLDTQNATWLLWLSTFLGFLVIPPVSMLAPPAPTRRKTWPLAALPALLVATALVALSATGHPSVEHARALMHAGATGNAIAELRAGVELGIDVEAAELLHDELQVGFVEGIVEANDVWIDIESRHFYTGAGRQRAEAHGLELTVGEAGSRLEEDEDPASEALLKLIPPRLQDEEDVLDLWRRIHELRVTTGWAEIRSRQLSLATRMAVCEAIEPATRYLEEYGNSLTQSAAPTKETVDQQCERLAEQQRQEIDRAQRRAEQERARQEREAELTQKRKEQAYLSAVWAWQRAPLLCRDGTMSPSCVCGQGSRRGCCSHHRGVSGCSQRHPQKQDFQ